MAAPRGNTNRKGKTGQDYNLSVPRLKCGNCVAKEWCPIVGKPEDTCGFLRRLRNQRNQLNDIDGVRAVRRQLLLETLTQLNIMSMTTEAKGISTKEMITYRKMLLEQFANLEKDMFDQDMKSKNANSQGNFMSQLISELGQKKALPEPEAIDVPFRVIPTEELVNVER